jgi:hypothetical protein
MSFKKQVNIDWLICCSRAIRISNHIQLVLFKQSELAFLVFLFLFFYFLADKSVIKYIIILFLNFISGFLLFCGEFFCQEFCGEIFYILSKYICLNKEHKKSYRRRLSLLNLSHVQFVFNSAGCLATTWAT